MFRCVVGHSNSKDIVEATEEAIKQCLQSINEYKKDDRCPPPKVALFFSTVRITKYDFDEPDRNKQFFEALEVEKKEFEEALKLINEKLNNIKLIGCTSDGCMSHLTDEIEDAVVLAVLCADDDIRFFTAFEEIEDDCYNALGKAVDGIKKVIEKGINKDSSNLIIGFFEGLTGFKEDIITSLNAAIGSKLNFINSGSPIPVIGGLAADNYNMKRTYQFYDKTVSKSGVILMLIYGDYKWGVGVDSGWKTFSEEAIIEEVENNRIFKVKFNDQTGISIIEFYSYFLGKVKEDQTVFYDQFPIQVENSYGDRFFRSPIDYSFKDGSIKFIGRDFKKGDKIKVAYYKEEDLIDAASNSIEQAFANVDIMDTNNEYNPQMMFFISCTSRSRLFLRRSSKEINYVYQKMGGNFLPLLGFYSFGEFAPVKKNEHSKPKNTFINNTIVSLLISTKDPAPKKRGGAFEDKMNRDRQLKIQNHSIKLHEEIDQCLKFAFIENYDKMNDKVIKYLNKINALENQKDRYDIGFEKIYNLLSKMFEKGKEQIDEIRDKIIDQKIENQELNKNVKELTLKMDSLFHNITLTMKAYINNTDTILRIPELADKDHINLTNEELNVALLVHAGFNTKDIAAIKNVSEKGVDRQRYNIITKMEGNAPELFQDEANQTLKLISALNIFFGVKKK